MDVSHSVCYNVVKVFSLNRIFFLAETQAFAHCCELLLVWGKMFSLQYRKAKTVWENVYMYNFDIVWGVKQSLIENEVLFDTPELKTK